MKLTGHDPYDALAAIFLGNGDARDAPTSGALAAAGAIAAPPPDDQAPAARRLRSSSLSLESAERPGASLLRVTAAVTGHLPVMAGLWATQYADRVGAVDGPTGLIRCERELVHVEILRSGGRHIGFRSGESLGEWLARAAQVIRRWVICLSGTEHAADVLDPRFADRVLLTSADETAIAAAQRVIEMIDDAAASASGATSLGVLVVGAPPDRATWMADQLASQARAALDLPLAGTIQRLDRVESAERYGFEMGTAPAPGELLHILMDAANRAVDRLGDGVMHSLRRPPPMPASPASAARTTAPVVADVSREEPPPPISAAPRPSAPLDVHAPVGRAPDPAAPPTPAVRAPEHSMAPVSTQRAPEEPAVPPTMSEPPPIVAPARAGPVDLAPYIAGLTALGMRCPAAPEVELAADGAGRLHLVAAATAAMSLRAARLWAVTNAELVARAFPQLTAPIGLSVIERVVTFDAVAVETLHGSGAALDLLVAIPHEPSGGGANPFRHVPLNRAAQGADGPVLNGAIA